MLVRPGGVAVGGMDHAVDLVGADEIPGIDWRAAMERVAGQFGGIDGFDPAIDGVAIRSSTGELRLVDIDAFFVLRGGTVGDAGFARPAGKPIAGRILGRSQYAIIDRK